MLSFISFKIKQYDSQNVHLQPLQAHKLVK